MAVSVVIPKKFTMLTNFPQLNYTGIRCLIDFYEKLGGLEKVTPKSVFINPSDNDEILRRMLMTGKKTETVRFWLTNGPQESQKVPKGSVLIQSDN